MKLRKGDFVKIHPDIVRLKFGDIHINKIFKVEKTRTYQGIGFVYILKESHWGIDLVRVNMKNVQKYSGKIRELKNKLIGGDEDGVYYNIKERSV
jgi:hypothetical protein